jgi:DnaK suppressor protein
VKAPVKKSKAPVKPAAKPAAKAASKAPVKAAVKTPSRPAAKAIKKAPAKALPKSSPKPAAKPVVKAVKKPAPPAKGAARSTPVASKPAPKKPAPAKVTKPASPAAKPIAKSTAKPVPKVPLKKTSSAPAAKASPATAPVKARPVAKPAVAAAVAVPAKPPVAVKAPAPETSNGLPPRPPLKPGRRSSARVATPMSPPAPMVPTHAPDAAKASYSTMTERVIAPPPHVAAKKDPKLANNWKSKPAEELSDEEVKAMPDSEYMNENQMAFFRHKLSLLKRDIHNSAGETTEHLREDTVVVPDPADRATIEEEHALELRTRDRERKLLKKIEQSIARIDSGDYGYCDETGEPIGVGRLIARPTANLSLEAQQRRELKQKMFGD